MRKIRRRAAAVAAAAAISVAVGGSVLAATRSADESALAPTRAPAGPVDRGGVSTRCSGG